MKRYEEIFWNELEVKSQLSQLRVSTHNPYIIEFAKPTDDCRERQEYKDFALEIMNLAKQRGFKASALPQIGRIIESQSGNDLLNAKMKELEEESRKIEEEWRDVPGYENLEVSKIGRVRNKKTGKILKGSYSYGYIHISANGNGKKGINAHRAVAMAFPEITGFTDANDKKKYAVNHKNEDKLDNHADNLEHITREENSNYGTVNKRIGIACSKKIRCIETGKVYNSIKDAANELYALNQYSTVHSLYSLISKVLNKKAETAAGFHWEYAVN